MATPLPPDADALPADVTQAFDQWLDGKQRILVVSHERPDGDAFGSLCGAVRALRNAGKDADGYSGTPLPRKLHRLQRHDAVRTEGPDLRTVDGILCLDCGSPERVDAPDKIAAEVRAGHVCNIDHHPDNTRFGTPDLVVPDAAATAEILTWLFAPRGWMDPAAADALLAGIVLDTGGFRFPNTSARTLRTVASLQDSGADLPGIMDELFHREPLGRLRLEAMLVETARFAFDQRLCYAVLPPKAPAEFGLRPEDLEGLIDVLRSIDGVEMACLLQPQNNDCMRFSFRARSSRFPVGPLARALGGGGHELAAGARVENTDETRAEKRLLELAAEVFAQDAS